MDKNLGVKYNENNNYVLNKLKWMEEKDENQIGMEIRKILKLNIRGLEGPIKWNYLRKCIRRNKYRYYVFRKLKHIQFHWKCVTKYRVNKTGAPFYLEEGYV